jgi:hypothetical protein
MRNESTDSRPRADRGRAVRFHIDSTIGAAGILRLSNRLDTRTVGNRFRSFCDSALGAQALWPACDWSALRLGFQPGGFQVVGFQAVGQPGVVPGANNRIEPVIPDT